MKNSSMRLPMNMTTLRRPCSSAVSAWANGESITLVYIRFFFDQGMLYVNDDLMSRFTFIDSQLIYFLIGGVALTLFHIFTEVEEPKKQRKSRKK